MLILFVTAVFASDGEKSSTIGNIVIPSPTKPAKATECVAPTDVMRREHMDLLNHQRDKTVIDGVRSNKLSLVECINCHVQPDANGQVARSSDPEHFCAGCHMFTGVKIDCFECHADRPVGTTYRHSLGADMLHHLASNHSTSSDLSTDKNVLQIFIEQAVGNND